MKAKIKRGSGFRGALDYVLSKDEPRVVGGNMSGQSPRELAKEFAAARMLKPGIEKPVWHTSLSAAPGERLTDQQWSDVADRFMKGMGFSDATQYVVVRHTPLQDQLNPPEPTFDKNGKPKKAGPECEHVHIVASRVGLDGKVWLGQNDVHLAIEQTQQIEQEFDLVRTKGFDGPKAVKALTRGEAGMAMRTEEMAPREYLQHTIAGIVATKPTMGEFIEKAQAAGIELRANVASTGRMNGFSFSRDGIHFSGQQLGAQFKWGTLQKSIDYQPERDTALLQQISAKAVAPQAETVSVTTVPVAPEPTLTLTLKEPAHGGNGRTGPDRRDAEREPAARAGRDFGAPGHRDLGRRARAHDEPRHRAVEAARRPPPHLEGGLHHVSESHVVLGWRGHASPLRADVPRGLEFGRAAGHRALFGTRGGAPAAAVTHLSSTGHKGFRPASRFPSFWPHPGKKSKHGINLTKAQKKQLEEMADRLAHLLVKLVCRMFGLEYQTPHERQQLERQQRQARVMKDLPPTKPAHEAKAPEPAHKPEAKPTEHHEPKRPVARPVDPERAKRAELAKASIGNPPAAAPAEPQHDPQAERREASRKVQEAMARQREERLEAQRLERERAEAQRRAAEQKADADRRAQEHRRDEEIRDDREADRRDEDREHDAHRKEIEHAIAKKGLPRSTALERYAERGDWSSVDRMIDEGTHVKGKAMDAAAKAGKDDAFKKMVSSRMDQTSDASDLQKLAKECTSPEAKQKLERMIAEAKGSSLSDMGLAGPKAPSAKPGGMSGPSMGGGPSGGGGGGR